MKSLSVVLCAMVILCGCSSMNSTTKGGLMGGGGGALLGAVAGALIGGNTESALIGAGVGAAVGTGAGVLIGNKMDKAAAAAKEVENATVETVTDANGLKAVKVTFESGILFATGKYDLSNSAKTSLTEFSKVLKNYTDADVAIYGHTDSTGTAAVNQPLSENRAKAVASYLESQGVKADQVAKVQGLAATMPVASNGTKAGREQNRRVEVYMYASEEMIKEANAGTLK